MLIVKLSGVEMLNIGWAGGCHRGATIQGLRSEVLRPHQRSRQAGHWYADAESRGHRCVVGGSQSAIAVSVPPKRNRTAPQFFQTQVSVRVNFDVLRTFEDMSQSPMTASSIRTAFPPADFGVSVICVGAPVERDEQDVQEEDMEDEGMEEVGEMGDSDGMDSGEEAVHDLTSPQ
jgi:hypothetical protein